MKKMNFGFWMVSLLSFFGVAAMSILTVNANVIITDLGPGNNLYNTGVNNSGSPLSVGTMDTHYTVAFYDTGGLGGSGPLSSGPPANFTPITTTTYPYASSLAYDTVYNPDSWVGNPTPPSSSAQWITYSDTLQSEPNTPYDQVTVYQLVLSGIPENVPVTIGGNVAADDNVTIYANGQPLGNYSDYSATDNGTNNNSNYNQLNALPLGLTFTSSGSSTSDTLDFLVYNNGGYPTGFLAQLTGSYATSTAVPEPSTYTLLGVGLLIWARARRAPRNIS